MTEESVPYVVGQADTRPWGRWKVIGLGEGFVVKEISVRPSARLSAQYHRHRAEHWTIAKGEGEVEVGGEARVVRRGDHVFIPVHSVHRIRNTGTEWLTFVEVQIGDRLEEADIVRVSDDYGRS